MMTGFKRTVSFQPCGANFASLDSISRKTSSWPRNKRKCVSMAHIHVCTAVLVPVSHDTQEVS